MLYDEAAVKAGIRNRDGKRVFYLAAKDNLTPSARDWLQSQRIQIIPASMAKIQEYQLPSGAAATEKPEHMTHLRGNILVPKTHPIIAFRGAMDTLQAEILLAQLVVAPGMQHKLEQILTLARNILSWEVMKEPAVAESLCGLTLQQQRSHSHRPQDYYGQPHFMPRFTDGPALLQLNRVRCAARHAELAAAHAFCHQDGSCDRADILQLLNRMSSMIYILMIQLKAEQK